jgi:hypothetical protein
MMSFAFFFLLFFGIPFSIMIIVDVISLHSYNKDKKEHPERYRSSGRSGGGSICERTTDSMLLQQIDWDIREGNRQRQMEEIRKRFHLGG